MNEKNKRVGLDCEMCNNTKCPNEAKEKIIDGVDVSGCENYFVHKSRLGLGEHSQCSKELYGRCEGNDCLYKQLKRLEEECKLLHEAQELAVEQEEELKRLQKENEELKEKINIYENSIIANHDRAVGKRLMETLQALEEIREIVLKKEYLSLFECLDDVWDIANKALSEVLK